MTRRAFAGLVLCAILLGATWPTLAALPALPGRIVAGGVYAVTQGSGANSINESLVENVTRQGWADFVSPEILALGTLAGEAVLVRGANATTFVQIERGTWISSANASGRGAFAGSGLAARLGLSVGDNVTLVGSTTPRLLFVRIAGVFRTDTPANDELLVDVSDARFLTGVGPDGYHLIRVRTSDPAAMIAFLEATPASVHVSGPGIPSADIHSEPSSDERIANLILRTGQGGAPRDYLGSAVAEAATSVRVVAYGIAVFLAILVGLGIHAVQARAFADRAESIGVLRALGAGNGWMRRRLLRESLPPALLAGFLGAALGLVVQTFLQPRSPVVVFGHEVVPSFDAVTFALIVLIVVGISSASALTLLQRALRARPTETIREGASIEPPQSLEVVLRG